MRKVSKRLFLITLKMKGKFYFQKIRKKCIMVKIFIFNEILQDMFAIKL